MRCVPDWWILPSIIYKSKFKNHETNRTNLFILPLMDSFDTVSSHS